MKISTKGRYGLRAMVDLAVYSCGEHVSLSSIAERQEVSVSYLEQVFSALRKAGLVKSVKGAQGGYVLAGSPGDVTVGTILRALEGDLSIIDDNKDTEGGTVQNCIKAAVWDKINERIHQVVDSITLEDLAEQYKRLNADNGNMYYI